MSYRLVFAIVLIFILTAACENSHERGNAISQPVITSAGPDVPAEAPSPSPALSISPSASSTVLPSPSPALSPVLAVKSLANYSKFVIHDMPRAGRKVALTFDDGPDDKFTPRILDILKKNGIKATFFVTGAHAQQYPQMIKRITAEGNVIGNHSWDHAYLPKLPADQSQVEISETDDMVKRITGKIPVLFRAPYGALSIDIVEEAKKTGHSIIGWSVDTRDWDGQSVQQIMANVVKEMRPGGIILQHCSGGKNGNLDNTVEALPQIIAYLKQNGYSFVTVPELLAAKG